MNESVPDWFCEMPFFIDTDDYTDRDREMFVCGVEFQMVYAVVKAGAPVRRPIHTENESRIRMMCARLGSRYEIGKTAEEGWSDLLVWERTGDPAQ